MRDMRNCERNRQQGKGTEKSVSSKYVKRAASCFKHGGHTQKYDSDTKYREDCMFPQEGPPVPRILWFERRMSNGTVKWINADLIKFGGYLVDMRSESCPDGQPARDDEIAWQYGVLTPAAKAAALPEPENPPNLGELKPDGSHIIWFDLEGRRHSSADGLATEVFNEPATRTPAGDDYVAQKEKQEYQ